MMNHSIHWARIGSIAVVSALSLDISTYAQKIPADVLSGKIPKQAKTRSEREKQAEGWFDMLDANGDGRLSRQEGRWIFVLRPSLAKDFEAADLNGDGYISKDEIRTVADRRRAEREARRARKAAASTAQAASSAASATPTPSPPHPPASR